MRNVSVVLAAGGALMLVVLGVAALVDALTRSVYIGAFTLMGIGIVGVWAGLIFSLIAYKKGWIWPYNQPPKR